MPAPYQGRFAPSPTGPLHQGSLVAALGSWLAARAAGGRWQVRIEDLDQPRCPPGTDQRILQQLSRHGLEWDGAVLYQSRRDSAYASALDHLRQHGLAYPCRCTRADLATAPRTPDGERRYPGTCRAGIGTDAGTEIDTSASIETRRHSWRLRTDAATIKFDIEFDDAVFGPQREDVAALVGDFIVRRADGVFAYQLAVVVDDAYQGITEIVRGADLLGNTARQIYLQRLLGLPTPRYLHLPLIVNPAGQKLSKQNHAPALPDTQPERALAAALTALGHAPPAAGGSCRELLEWGLAHWSVACIPRTPMPQTDERPIKNAP